MPRAVGPVRFWVMPVRQVMRTGKGVVVAVVGMECNAVQVR